MCQLCDILDTCSECILPLAGMGSGTLEGKVIRIMDGLETIFADHVGVNLLFINWVVKAIFET